MFMTTTNDYDNNDIMDNCSVHSTEIRGLVEAEFKIGRLDETAKLVVALIVDEQSSAT